MNVKWVPAAFFGRCTGNAKDNPRNSEAVPAKQSAGQDWRIVLTLRSFHINIELKTNQVLKYQRISHRPSTVVLLKETVLVDTMGAKISLLERIKRRSAVILHNHSSSVRKVSRLFGAKKIIFLGTLVNFTD